MQPGGSATPRYPPHAEQQLAEHAPQGELHRHTDLANSNPIGKDATEDLHHPPPSPPPPQQQQQQ